VVIRLAGCYMNPGGSVKVGGQRECLVPCTKVWLGHQPPSLEEIAT